MHFGGIWGHGAPTDAPPPHLCHTRSMTSTAPTALEAVPEPARRRWRGLPRWLAALGLVLAAAYAGHQVALQTGLSRLREAAEHRLDMLATGLEADLSRFDYLPALLKMTPVVPALLEAPADPQLRDTVSRYLNGVNGSVGAEMLYVLDPGGTSLAASDWQQPGTTVGQDLSFRPYVIDAIKLGRGRFYGVGITSRQARLLPVVRATPRRAPAGCGCGEGRHRRRRTCMAQAARRRAADRRARGGDPVDPRRPQVPARWRRCRRPSGPTCNAPDLTATPACTRWTGRRKKPWPPMPNSSRWRAGPTWPRRACCSKRPGG